MCPVILSSAQSWAHWLEKEEGWMEGKRVIGGGREKEEWKEGEGKESVDRMGRGREERMERWP